jgi:hypothetical protein
MTRLRVMRNGGRDRALISGTPDRTSGLLNRDPGITHFPGADERGDWLSANLAEAERDRDLPETGAGQTVVLPGLATTPKALLQSKATYWRGSQRNPLNLRGSSIFAPFGPLA